MAIITIKSIKAKITELKKTRRVRQRLMQISVLEDMLSLISTRLGPDAEVSEVTNAMGEEDCSGESEGIGN